MEKDQEVLSLDEAAFVLKVGVPTVESLIHRELLPAEDHDGSYVVRRQDLVELMRRNQQELDQNDDGDAAQDFGLIGQRTDE